MEQLKDKQAEMNFLNCLYINKTFSFLFLFGFLDFNPTQLELENQYHQKFNVWHVELKYQYN